MSGVTCAPNPLVLQPAQSGTCTFRNAGSYAYSDPNVRGNTFRGTVTVTGPAPPEDTLTLTVKPRIVVYGGKVALAGVLSSQKVGENVDILVSITKNGYVPPFSLVRVVAGTGFEPVISGL